MNGNIFNSKGVHVGVVTGDAVFGLKGQKLYDLKGSNIYKLNGDLVGHLSDARSKEKRLDKTTDKLFPKVKRSGDLPKCRAFNGGFASSPRKPRGIVSPRLVAPSSNSRASSHTKLWSPNFAYFVGNMRSLTVM